ncbi:unnamed protein product [Lactuca saligna]|uniref:Dof zinc finger protein n=1 Tax=Lactuca saligna TaxID=75948 RepID=A0AA35YT49_LACSI|nr:unnamed protein product [Lactuca saligna]
MSQKESGRRPQQQVAPPSFPPPSCPRCYSDHTKFCYYNNYTVSQPRYYCKDCRRYWTHGGALRNIPTGGTSRKRGRIDTASSTSRFMLPPPTTAWELGAPDNSTGGFGSPSIGRGTFPPPITETMLSFNCGGGSNQTSFRFGPGGEFGGVNTALDAFNVGFGGGALPPAARSNPYGFRDSGFPRLQRQQHHQPPPSVWTAGHNMALNSTGTIHSNPINFLSIAPATTANVVSISEWSELNDIDYEGDPLQRYKPPSP